MTVLFKVARVYVGVEVTHLQNDFNLNGNMAAQVAQE